MHPARPRLLIAMVCYGGADRARDTMFALLEHAERNGFDTRAVIVDNFEAYGIEEKKRIDAAWKSVAPDAIVVNLHANADEEHDSLDGESAWTSVRYVFSNRNLGYAAGNNLAARIGRVELADYLLVATPDVILETADGFTRLRASLDAAPAAACVGPRIVDAHEIPQGPYRYQGAAARYGSLLWAPLRRLVRGTYFSDEVIRNVEHGSVYRIMGCFMLFRAADFLDAGGFDEATFLYGEEAIMAERLRAIDRKVWYEGGVTVRHEPGESISTRHNAAARLRLRFESDMYYYRTYRNSSRASRLIARAGLEMFLRVWVPLGGVIGRA